VSTWSALAVAGVGALVLAASVVGARRREVHPAEQAVFRWINRWPDQLFWPLWVVMQLGNLVVGTAVGIVVALLVADGWTAAAVVVAMLLKRVTERVVRAHTAGLLDHRQRPGTSQPGAILRGRDVPRAGLSFPSGHVLLVTVVACVVVADLPPGWRWAPWVLISLVMVGRVYVGAHLPLDATAGFGAGLVAGGLLELVLR
jgi:undecaprenyl-diphosphatase